MIASEDISSSIRELRLPTTVAYEAEGMMIPMVTILVHNGINPVASAIAQATIKAIEIK